MLRIPDRKPVSTVFKMKIFTPSKIILLFFMTFVNGQHQDKAPPAACHYLEFLL